MKLHPFLILFSIYTVLVFADTAEVVLLYSQSYALVSNFSYLHAVYTFVLSGAIIFTTYMLIEFIKKVDSLKTSRKVVA